MLVLCRDRGRLLPLAVEAVMNQRVVGVDGSGLGPVASRATGSGSTTLAGQEGRLGRGIAFSLTLAGGGFLGITGALLRPLPGGCLGSGFVRMILIILRLLLLSLGGTLRFGLGTGRWVRLGRGVMRRGFYRRLRSGLGCLLRFGSRFWRGAGLFFGSRGGSRLGRGLRSRFRGRSWRWFWSGSRCCLGRRSWRGLRRRGRSRSGGGKRDVRGNIRGRLGGGRRFFLRSRLGARCFRNVIRDHIVSLRGLGGNRWLSDALLSLGKGSRFHPRQLACGFFNGLCEPPDQPPDDKEMDRCDENESPAEAGFLAGHGRASGGRPLPDPRDGS